jgi:hypothetical protein
MDNTATAAGAEPAPNAVRLNALKDSIESLSKAQHVDILRVCHERGIIGTENKNGVFINLTRISEKLISELENYLTYINKQEAQLNEVELQKKEIATKYFM